MRAVGAHAGDGAIGLEHLQRQPPVKRENLHAMIRQFRHIEPPVGDAHARRQAEAAASRALAAAVAAGRLHLAVRGLCERVDYDAVVSRVRNEELFAINCEAPACTKGEPACAHERVAERAGRTGSSGKG